jgi:hypothetical protein
MNGATRTTAIMGLISAAVVAAAFYYYPKPVAVVADAKVGTNLFETYEVSDVRWMIITKFNSESNQIEQFRVRRIGERWVLPKSNDFDSVRIALVGEVAKSLLDREVLSLATEDEQGHVEFGVVDPAEAGNTPNRSSLGLKIQLQNRDRSDIASLIVGNAVPGDKSSSKFYVRVTGEPAVYELEIPKGLYSTRFKDWADPNLLAVPSFPPAGANAVRVSNIDVEHYQIPVEKITGSSREDIYKLSIPLSLEQKPPKLEVFKEGKFKEVEIDEKLQPQVALVFRSVTGGRLPLEGVLQKPKDVAKALRKRGDLKDAKVLKLLLQYGFRASQEDSAGAVNFEGSGGSIFVSTTDGVKVQCLIGSIATQTGTQDLALNYNAMLVASLDESAFTAPEKPEGVEEDSDENKAYLRAVAAIELKKKSAQIRIDELNLGWSKWIYIIPEAVVNALRPDIEG